MVLSVATLAAFFVLALGWFAVVFTGRWPEGLRSFVLGWLRWAFRVSGYLWLITDDYPPFGFQA